MSAEGTVYGESIHDSHVDCTGMPDGVAEIGCDGYVECIQGTTIKHLCTTVQYFDRDTMSCVP